MKITMISNYINHHQIPFSNAIYEKIGEDYAFIQTEPMEEERRLMGWGVDETEIPYVKFLYEDEEACKKLIEEADILLVGWMEREDLIEKRLLQNRLTIRISERIYREGQYKAISPRGLLRKYKEHTRFRKNDVYLLCAGAYVPSDFHIVKAYPGKMLRFGYFPETIYYDKNTLFAEKEDISTVHMVWAGRFMPLKHPEYAIALAKDLQKEGYAFHLHMIGSGVMEEDLKKSVSEYGLEDKVTFYGFMEPKKVREYMEKSHIHLFTSNHLEGWGAVVNEGMNSGLAEVVNSSVGSAPFLITHGVNGLIYKEGDYEDFLLCVKKLFANKELITRLGQAAYDTITTEWNAEHAVKELFRFYEGYLKKDIQLPQSGPFSPAPVISPGKMYAHIMEKARCLPKR